MNKKQILKPKYDIVFQTLFGSNKENITQSFISDILGKPIEIIDIKTDDSVLKHYPSDKAGRLDLKTKFRDGTICQVEMQMTDEGNTIKRILYYWARTFSNQLKSGAPYTSLNKTIGIIITNYEVKELKGIEELNTCWKIMDTKSGKKVLTDDLEFYILELSKVEKALQKDKHNRLAGWLAFLDNPYTERVEEIMKENEEVKKAQTVLNEMSEDEILQRWAELKEKWEHDEVSAREYYKETGLKEGREQGREEKQKEIAKKMKYKKMDIQEIIEITGLTKEEIEKL